MKCPNCNLILKFENNKRNEFDFHYCDCSPINIGFSYNTRVYLCDNIIYYYHFLIGNNYFVQASGDQVNFYSIIGKNLKHFYKIQKFINIDNSNKFNENVNLINKYFNLLIFT